MRTARRGSRVRGAGEGGGAGRAGHGGVGRLRPAAAGAGHAADEDVGALAVGEPGADDPEQHRLEAVRVQRDGAGGGGGLGDDAVAASIAQARRLELPQSTAIQSAVMRWR